MAPWIALVALFCVSLVTVAEDRSGVASTGQTVYVFGFHPHLNPRELYAAYRPILDYLERKLPDVRFRLEGARDYGEFEARLAARHYDFALPNPVQTLAAQKAGYRVIAKNYPDEDFRGQLVARKGRVRHLHELAGQTVCFPSETAVAATLLPLDHLQRHGVPVKSLERRYVGTQVAAILNAYAGDAAACGVSARFYRAWARDEPAKAQPMEILFTTEPAPHNAVVARNDLPPALTERVASALVDLERDPQVDTSVFKLGQHRFERASDATYAPFRRFLERYDREIGLPAALKPVIAR